MMMKMPMDILKGFFRVTREQYVSSRLHKIRLYLILAVLFSLILQLTGIGVNQYLFGTFIIGQMIAAFYPQIMGLVVRPILARTMTLVTIEDRTGLAAEYHYDMSWHFFEMSPEVWSWVRANCRGLVGVLPTRYEGWDVSPRRVFFFSNANDAFAFRMRWSGL